VASIDAEHEKRLVPVFRIWTQHPGEVGGARLGKGRLSGPRAAAGALGSSSGRREAIFPRGHRRGDPTGPPATERLERILLRDGAECVWCRRALAPGDRHLSLEHVVPRLKGGPAWAENEVVACRSCNRKRGHASPAEWLDECERRGLRPNRAAIRASLERLERAIAERGGQRRARPYLAGQLRRLACS